MNTMTITRSFLVGLLTALSIGAWADEPTNTSPAPAVAIFMMDDQTGPELERVHGIKPIQISDLEVLVNGIAGNTKTVRLFQQEVEEDATNASTITLDFQLFAGGPPPKAPADDLPLGELETATEKFRQDRNTWLLGMVAYRQALTKQAEDFIRQANKNQADVAAHFDLELAVRNGRDFNRSDCAGCILTANRLLGNAGLRVLLINSDADDEPAHRPPRRTAFLPNELSPEISIIFVNKSHIPDASPLFKGLSNPTYHASTLLDAMGIILKLMNGQTVPPSGTGTPIAQAPSLNPNQPIP